MIPKRISTYWSGHKMSWLRYMTLYSLRKLNPNYMIYLYLDKPNSSKNNPWGVNQSDSFYYDGKDYTDRVEELDIDIIEIDNKKHRREPAHNCDIKQWEIMSQQGGLFVDMDILFIKGFDSMLKDAIADYNTIICYSRYLTIGLTGSSGCNGFYNDVRKRSIRNYKHDKYQSCGVNVINSLLGHRDDIQKVDYTSSIISRYKDATIYNMPFDWLYRYDYNNLSKIYGTTSSTDGMLGLHWYGGAKASVHWNNILNISTLYHYSNTITKVLKGLLC